MLPIEVVAVVDIDFYWGLMNYTEPYEYDRHGPNYGSGRQFGILFGHDPIFFDKDAVRLTPYGYAAVYDALILGLLI